MTQPDAIYLSPHLDDVVLSCGGMIHARARAGARALVVTFFAASPANDAITPFALELKERWGNAPDPVGMRRQEDLAAVGALGAQALHLPFPDCVYRQDPSSGQACYPTVEHIFADVHPAEEMLPGVLLEDLLQRVGDFGDMPIYAPLTAGHHVDHILVQRTALMLLERGQRVFFYEDYPYAGNSAVVEAALLPWPGHCWERETVRYLEEDLLAKGRAVACYASQISTFWQGVAEMQAALRAQAQAVGGGRYGENLWHLEPACLADDP